MDDAIDSFLSTARRIVYSTLATVDRRGRPRSRIVHPVWQLEGERLVGWVGTRPTSLKRESLTASAFASCLRSAAATAAGEPYAVWEDG
jgi:hypothetical protein